VIRGILGFVVRGSQASRRLLSSFRGGCAPYANSSSEARRRRSTWSRRRWIGCSRKA